MQITWFGHSAFRSLWWGRPCSSIRSSPETPPSSPTSRRRSRVSTHIVLTHGHGDHVGDALEIAHDRRPGGDELRSLQLPRNSRSPAAISASISRWSWSALRCRMTTL